MSDADPPPFSGPLADPVPHAPQFSQETEAKAEASHWGPLATILWGAFIAIVCVGCEGIMVFIYLVVTTPGLSSAQVKGLTQELSYDGALLSLCTLVNAVIISPLILVIAKLKRGSRLKDYLGLILPSKREALRWFLALIVFLALADLTSLLLRQPIVPDFMVRTYASMKNPWILWVALLVGAPLLEELFFRGFLIKGLMDSPLRWYGAVVITSAAWALIHVQYDIYGTAMIFALGLVLGTARVKSGSTLLTIGLHSIVNLGATIETVLHLSS